MASLLPDSAREAFQQVNITVIKFFLTFVFFIFLGRLLSNFLPTKRKLAKEIIIKGFVIIGAFVAWIFAFF
jgi:hypothetical protein